SVHDRPGSTCIVSPRPPVLSVPQAKQLCGANSNRSTSLTDTTRSDVKILHLARLRLDEVLARRDLFAHEHREDLVRRGGVLAVDPEQGARLRVHRGLPELVGIHLAEALEPLHAQVLDVELL